MSKIKGKVLIVDDNEELLIALKFFLSKYFEKIETLRNPNLIHEQLRKCSFDIVLLDMNFKAGINSGNEGFYWMKRILETDPQIAVILITAYGDVELAVRAIKEGAADFIQKSWDEEKILSTILSAYNLRLSKQKIKVLEQKQQHLNNSINQDLKPVFGKSESMQKVLDLIDKVAETEANVLILGENGTGKEVIAREIHRKSSRSDEVFINVDLGAIHENLFESELFGHARGAFTDAKENRAGRFEIASGGTLFLDEIGNLPLSLQSKLLTAIQNKEIYPVGLNIPVPVNIRLICATNKDLDEMIENNTFREDLLYRINTIKIELPPLRERTDDILPLAEVFLEKYTSKYNKEGIRFHKDTIVQLKQYSWPGNIRELQHVIEKALILCDNNFIMPAHCFSDKDKSSKQTVIKTLNIEQNEKFLIERALLKYKGNMSAAANELGINRSTLYKKIEKYDIQPL